VLPPGDCRSCGRLTAPYRRPEPDSDLRLPVCAACLVELHGDDSKRVAFEAAIAVELRLFAERLGAEPEAS
jgi:hypothetical protein